MIFLGTLILILGPIAVDIECDELVRIMSEANDKVADKVSSTDISAKILHNYNIIKLQANIYVFTKAPLAHSLGGLLLKGGEPMCK